MSKYIEHPASVKMLASEIIRACNDYYARKLSRDELRYLIKFYADHSSDKLFAGPQEYNRTVTAKIGSKRLRLIAEMLSGYQTKMF